MEGWGWEGMGRKINGYESKCTGRKGEERKIQGKQRKGRKTKGRIRRVISGTGESEGIEEKYLANIW